EKYAKEFATQKLLVPTPNAPGATRRAFSALDLDFDDRLSMPEYRQLMIVPIGAPGDERFQSLDSDHDGWLSREEFNL
ncbi:MAG: EF-hand domain-containing protein, partial [Sphingomicrobium sp.]